MSEAADDDSSWIKAIIFFTLVFSVLCISLVISLFFFLTNQLVGRAEGECCKYILICPHESWITSTHFTFYLFIYFFRVFRGHLYIFTFLFTWILLYFLPFFHLISSRTNTISSHPESVCQSVVPHFFCLHFITGSGKATFRTQLQSESSCCCLRRCSTADCACQGIYRSCTHSVSGAYTYTCSHPHMTNINTERFHCVMSSLLFMLPSVFLSSLLTGC